MTFEFLVIPRDFYQYLSDRFHQGFTHRTIKFDRSELNQNESKYSILRSVNPRPSSISISFSESFLWVLTFFFVFDVVFLFVCLFLMCCLNNSSILYEIVYMVPYFLVTKAVIEPKI